MSLLLVDSADASEIAPVVALGLAGGATTNPKLMRRVTDEPLDQLGLLLGLDLATIYYQPTGAYGPDLRAEAVRAHALAPARVVIKTMATPDGVGLGAELIRGGVPVALTGAMSAQAMVTAIALGCTAVIPYYDRGLRDPTVSASLIADLVAVRAGRPQPTVLAASIKNGEQVVDVLRQGADSVSAPADVLLALASHPSSLAAEQEFLSQYRSTERP